MRSGAAVQWLVTFSTKQDADKFVGLQHQGENTSASFCVLHSVWGLLKCNKNYNLWFFFFNSF